MRQLPPSWQPTKNKKKKLAKGRTCYVNMGQGVLIVFKMFLAGRYPDYTTPAKRRAVGRKRNVRIGTYGDGAAAPTYVWDECSKKLTGTQPTAITAATLCAT